MWSRLILRYAHGKAETNKRKSSLVENQEETRPKEKEREEKLPTRKEKKTSQMATQSIDWQCNNVVLVHYTEKGGIIELQRVTTAAGVELIDNSD